MGAFDLSGKVAAVTGGNGGIGLAMAEGLARAGASIMIIGRNSEKNNIAEGKLAALGVKASAFTADVTSEEDCAAAMAAAKDRFGRLDILINNAGTNIRNVPHKLSLQDWRTVIDTNLSSAFICSNAAYPLLSAEGGKIINIGSMLSIFGSSYGAAYAASKGGIVQLTKSQAVAWAPDNIQVNAILPGWINTDMTRQARIDVDGLHDRIQGRTPADRWGDPEDLAGVAVFLSAAASNFVTGTAIPVDGGFSVNI
ncbi:SDR family oxidoreductase [uncultured Nisaea sp.]|uniref:SDR family NAD(P)-dependent oxidoreductase n=1 Tax=uncultured Nisaea sp. TaxID=538215 RepID=UPI0030ED7494|tara:strand:+ start:853 stop:1614 length:762 start_codon:yes stop_codon:yes gene_type:complete